ncbi:MAG TPA: hypothetical protein VFJ85_03285 [Acidimicrobiales bacterium]|nr:hypothetical protein [Acidimicrobiales bacterium]
MGWREIGAVVAALGLAAALGGCGSDRPSLAAPTTTSTTITTAVDGGTTGTEPPAAASTVPGPAQLGTPPSTGAAKGTSASSTPVAPPTSFGPGATPGSSVFIGEGSPSPTTGPVDPHAAAMGDVVLGEADSGRRILVDAYSHVVIRLAASGGWQSPVVDGSAIQLAQNTSTVPIPSVAWDVLRRQPGTATVAIPSASGTTFRLTVDVI